MKEEPALRLKVRFPANVIHDGSEEVLEGFVKLKAESPGCQEQRQRRCVLTVKKADHQEHRCEDSVIRVQRHRALLPCQGQRTVNAGIVEAKGSTGMAVGYAGFVSSVAHNR